MMEFKFDDSDIIFKIRFQVRYNNNECAVFFKLKRVFLCIRPRTYAQSSTENERTPLL